MGPMFLHTNQSVLTRARPGHVQAQDAKCGDLLNTQDGPRGH